MTDFTDLPDDLPVPEDDGACEHLAGMKLPQLMLPATNGLWINANAIDEPTVIYIYPMTGRPGVALPEGWDSIPGARGCTPQSCAFSEQYEQLQKMGVNVYGLSTQSTDYQQEVVERLQLPFPLLSDEELGFINALRLPTFNADGRTLARRVTLIVFQGVIQKVFYPVFPPNENAKEVIQYLQSIQS